MRRRHSHVPHYYGNYYVNNSFVLSWIESIFGMEVLWEDRHQPHTSLL